MVQTPFEEILRLLSDRGGSYVGQNLDSREPQTALSLFERVWQYSHPSFCLQHHTFTSQNCCSPGLLSHSPHICTSRECGAVEACRTVVQCFSPSMPLVLEELGYVEPEFVFPVATLEMYNRTYCYPIPLIYTYHRGV